MFDHFTSCWKLSFATSLACGDTLGRSGPGYVDSGIQSDSTAPVDLYNTSQQLVLTAGPFLA